MAVAPPPPDDPNKAPIENVTEVVPIESIGPDIFTHTHKLWVPPGARGVYGGAVIAQCLSAAQMTVPLPTSENRNAVFLPHSMHCYFVLAGDGSKPILYHVERVREGKSFLTRTVQARQKDQCIFTTTISYVREGSEGQETLDQGLNMPEGMREELLDVLKENSTTSDNDEEEAKRSGVETEGPFISKRIGMYNGISPHPHARKLHSWLRSHNKIQGGVPAHLSALAYMSDSWFIGSAARVHKLSNLNHRERKPSPYLLRMNELELEYNTASKADFMVNNKPAPPSARIGMIVSLDHTIYFHRPKETKADEWLCSEMQSPWSGEGRGLVTQHIWNREGLLIATCIQEGLLRLNQHEHKGKDSKL